MSKALGYLGIARMSGNIVLGEENAKACIKAGKARMILLASDASEGVRKRVDGYVYGFHAPVVTAPWDGDAMGAALGRARCAVAVLPDLGLAKALADALASEDPETYGPVAAALEVKRARIAQRAAKTGKRRKSE